MPIGIDRKLAFQINYLSYGDFDRTNSIGEKLGTFGGSDFLFAVSYAMKIRNDLYAGATVKYISEKIDTYSATGIAFDFGAKYVIIKDLYDDRPRVSAGFMIQNLGTQLTTFTENGDKESLPLNFRFGGAALPKGLPVLIAADLVLPTDNDIHVGIGFETTKLQPLFLRIGWNSFGSNYKTDSGNDALAGFSAGFGIEYKRMQISYTVSPQADLGTSHRITLTGGIF
jgi:hypothetical protein